MGLFPGPSPGPYPRACRGPCPRPSPCACPGRSRSGGSRRYQCRRCRLTSDLLKGFEKRPEFQLCEKGCDGGDIQIVGFGVFQIQFDLEISFDLREVAAEIGVGFVGFELGLPAIFGPKCR